MMPSLKTSIMIPPILFLAAFCSCLYPISKQLRVKAQRENITFPMVLENPEAYKGRTVILGGIIIETVNVNDGTEIVVLDTPLDFMEKPKTATYSRGRFIAKDLKFLDPAVYKPDRYVTLAGEVEGVEERDLGKTTYMYPVVVIREIYLWESRNHRYNPYYYYWYDPWYGPGPYYYYVPYYRYSYPYRNHYRNDRHHR